MNAVQSILLQQMAMMAGSVSLPQVNADGGEKAGSFQDMLKQARPEDAEGQDKTEGVQKEEAPKGGIQDEEDPADPNRLQAAYSALDLAVVFQQNIQPAEETVVEEIPEIVAEAAPVVQAEMAVEAEVLPEEIVQQPETVTAVSEEPVQPEAAEAVDVEIMDQEAAPVENVKAQSRIERPETDQDDETGPVKGEVTVEREPLFQEVESAPVKVGETYELDTQDVELEAKLAKTIQKELDAGSERIEIRLNPDNLGPLTVEMTRTGEGALQVVLHAVSGKAANVLSEHLDGLAHALQGLGQEQVKVEVRQEAQSSQQHPFQQADPDGRGQHHGRQAPREQQEQQENGEDFLQQLRLGLLGG